MACLPNFAGGVGLPCLPRHARWRYPIVFGPAYLARTAVCYCRDLPLAPTKYSNTHRPSCTFSYSLRRPISTSFTAHQAVPTPVFRQTVAEKTLQVPLPKKEHAPWKLCPSKLVNTVISSSRDLSFKPSHQPTNQEKDNFFRLRSYSMAVNAKAAAAMQKGRVQAAKARKEKKLAAQKRAAVARAGRVTKKTSTKK